MPALADEAKRQHYAALYAQVAVHNAKPPSALHHKLIAFDIANAIAQ
jgi:hypothetical protein